MKHKTKLKHSSPPPVKLNGSYCWIAIATSHAPLIVREAQHIILPHLFHLLRLYVSHLGTAALQLHSWKIERAEPDSLNTNVLVTENRNPYWRVVREVSVLTRSVCTIVCGSFDPQDNMWCIVWTIRMNEEVSQKEELLRELWWRCSLTHHLVIAAFQRKSQTERVHCLITIAILIKAKTFSTELIRAFAFIWSVTSSIDSVI